MISTNPAIYPKSISGCTDVFLALLKSTNPKINTIIYPIPKTYSANHKESGRSINPHHPLRSSASIYDTTHSGVIINDTPPTNL